MKTDLGDLNAFLAVATARGFRDAARSSGASASALSEAVRRLETQLGVRLLHRTTRSVAPTEAGTRLLDRLGPALGEVGAALETVNSFRDRPAGTLRLNVPVSAARLVLPAIVPGFLAAYPDIEMEIIAEDSFVDMLASGCDAGIRYDERLEQDMIAVPIGPRTQRFATAASPKYLSHHGRPEHPRDLLAHACMRGRFSSGASMSPWEFERGVRWCASNRGVRCWYAPVRPPILRSMRRSRVLASSIYLRIGSARIWTAAPSSLCWRTGGSHFQARSSTIPAAGLYRRRSARFSTSSRWDINDVQQQS